MAHDTEGQTPESKSFPMPVEDFLAGDYLSRADVVLVRGNSLFGRAIRFATRSPFSHAALIFLVPHRQDGFERTFLIEAVPAGVSINALADVVKAGSKGPSNVAVSILRLERPWFDKDVKALVRGRMLDFIKAGYDWSTVLGLAWAVISGWTRGAEYYTRAIRRSLRDAYDRKKLAPANFICSGLVQYGFLRTVHDLSEAEGAGVPSEDVGSTIFNPRLEGVEATKILHSSPENLAELLATTPEDISRSAHLEWKYVILRGQVHAVASRDEAVAILNRS